MKCHICSGQAMFRARGEGDPFTWWCQLCYDAHAHHNLPHDIEHPPLCILCKDQPASFRISSESKTSWEYLCYACFEKFDHDEEIDDMLFADVDDPSESDEPEAEDGTPT